MIPQFKKLCLAGLAIFLIVGCSKVTHAPKVSDKPTGENKASESESVSYTHLTLPTKRIV